MATSAKNLSYYDETGVPDGSLFRIAVIQAEWNSEITGNLAKGAVETLLKHGLQQEHLLFSKVPGAFELPLAAQWAFEKDHVDAVITIGCVIQGETRHFDFVCEGLTQGVMDVSLKFSKPVIFCVLTDNTRQQSLDRSGGIHGNKGVESAIAALQMCALNRSRN